MKTEHKIIAGAVGFGLFFWIIDAILDYFFFYEGTLIGLMITDVPPHEVYIRCSAFVVFVAFGMLVSSILAKRRRVEDILREKQYYLAKAQEMGLIGTWELDVQKNILIWTDENYRIFGVPVGTEMDYELFLDCIHPDDRDYVHEKWSAALNGEFYDIEHRLIVNDKVKWVREKADIEFDAEGNPIIAIGFTQDITERKRAAQEIARLVTVVEQAAVTVMITDLEGDIVYANPDFETTTGYTVAEALGQNPRIVQSGYQDDSVYQELWDTIVAGRTWNGIFVNKRKDGELYHEEVTIFPIRSADGEIVNYAAVKRDVSERMQMEAAEERAQQYLDIAGVAFVILDRDGRITQVNRRGLELLGYQETELIGENWFTTCVPGRLHERVTAVFKQMMAGETEPVEYYENPLLTRDGEERIIAWHNSVLRDASGDIVGVVSSGEDITDRVQAEAERELLLAQIRAQARQIQQTIDTVPEGVLLLDARGRVILANPVAEGDLAILADAQVGDLLRPGSGQVLTQLGDHPLAELLTSPPTKGLWHEINADGRTFEVIARPMENGPEGDNWVLVIRDVTQEREIELAAQQQERLAAVGQLAAGIAHDFNNIMAVIVLYTQMGLRVPEIPDQLRERLEIVDRQAKRATDLIQQILDFSRRAVMERRPMDLVTFLKEVVRLLERVVPEDIKMEFAYGVDEYTVNADPTRMQQAIMNLVVNARDAMLSKGGGELHIVLSRAAATDAINCVTCGEVIGGEWVCIAVTDTGSGIPDGVLTHIFEPFYTTKEVGKGTGLGLAQVYGIVKQHEGHIDVTTEVGTGTTFIVYLPALLEAQPEAQSTERRTVVQGQGETILVVEDNGDLREALTMSVELLNYRVVAAADGREALDLLEQHVGEVSLVLSDLVMPEMGGAALFHALRQRGLTLPMVLLSGHPMEREMESLREEGVAGWMVKPPNMAQLSQLLARVLSEAAE